MVKSDEFKFNTKQALKFLEAVKNQMKEQRHIIKHKADIVDEQRQYVPRQLKTDVLKQFDRIIEQNGHRQPFQKPVTEFVKNKKKKGGIMVESKTLGHDGMKTGGKKTNPWLAFLSEYKQKHPKLSQKELMKKAKEAYSKMKGGCCLDEDNDKGGYIIGGDINEKAYAEALGINKKKKGGKMAKGVSNAETSALGQGLNGTTEYNSTRFNSEYNENNRVQAYKKYINYLRKYGMEPDVDDFSFNK